MKEKYTVVIGGIELTLLADEPEEYVLGLAKIIDQRINGMVQSAKRCSRMEAAMICALDFLDDKCKRTLEIESMKKQLEALKKENTQLINENDELKKLLDA